MASLSSPWELLSTTSLCIYGALPPCSPRATGFKNRSSLVSPLRERQSKASLRRCVTLVTMPLSPPTLLLLLLAGESATIARLRSFSRSLPSFLPPFPYSCSYYLCFLAGCWLARLAAVFHFLRFLASVLAIPCARCVPASVCVRTANMKSDRQCVSVQAGLAAMPVVQVQALAHANWGCSARG